MFILSLNNTTKKHTEVTMSNFWIIYYGIICIVGLIIGLKELKGGNNE